MIIKNNTTKLLLTLSFLLILPFIQKQWLNLYSLNINVISFYSIIYYLSGAICPSLVYVNSLKNYTYYKFNKDKIQSIKVIKGKRLLFLVAINLIFLSYLIAEYIYINFDLTFNLFLEGINVPKLDIPLLSFFIFLISILLIFKKSRFLLKKIILVNFILISFYLWHLQQLRTHPHEQVQTLKPEAPTANRKGREVEPMDPNESDDTEGNEVEQGGPKPNKRD